MKWAIFLTVVLVGWLLYNPPLALLLLFLKLCSDTVTTC